MAVSRTEGPTCSVQNFSAELQHNGRILAFKNCLLLYFLALSGTDIHHLDNSVLKRY